MADASTCKVTVGWDGPLATMAVAGKIAPNDLPYLRERVRRVSVNPRVKAMILDLSSAESFDSMVLGFLVSTLKLLQGSGQQLALVVNSPLCHEALRITGLVSLFSIFETHEEARRAVKL